MILTKLNFKGGQMLTLMSVSLTLMFGKGRYNSNILKDCMDVEVINGFLFTEL